MDEALEHELEPHSVTALTLTPGWLRSESMLDYYWQQADASWEYIWSIFPKAILWPAFMVY